MFEGILIAGFGGQGVLSTGQLLAYAGMIEDKHVAWIPSYGPEMRGGTANCGITISTEPISSPVVSEPTVLIAMNRPSLEKFEPTVVPGGLILVNSSLIDIKTQRTDVRTVYVPANDMAEELGNGKVANNIILGALLELTGVVSNEGVLESLKKVLPPKHHNLIPLNGEALEKGRELARGQA
ncbi:2-oxoacid:acceptor oxidoreductase family protein [Desulfallas thermosapovorans]|uniref:2-oxoglutarate ferredoxin oxidoreductase subunit gamma n=1 Tax=Desulfallas thermosapovorans DSM 6562 TaxID=1121431 RepID=A0A5S4ZSG9_9FIRM|nr:2-oxoacid:acceptor oxidoreductase family protein [Desulfallas thermosapovorans]TYO95602.1 2-oxoglutarate ferredoxin oxidoreductase subunit gamma [Desulfallas thermosapovorans DSM 6562]